MFPPPPAVCQSLHRPPLKLAQQSTATPAIYFNPQPPPQPPQPLTYKSVGVQTQRFSLSPSPSQIQLRVQDRRSLSSTPSVSPLSTPSGSPSMFNFVSPPQNGGAAAGYPPPGCSIVLPARTSPPARSALHLPAVSTNPLSFAAGSGQPFAAPLPYYHSPQTSSAAPVAQSAPGPMYFVDMNPPLSVNNRAGPPFPRVNFYQM